MTALSRLLGLIRDIIFAQFFGTKIVADAFVTAYTVPNLLRKLFGEGAFSGSFIPIFADYHHKDKESAWRLLNTILTVLVIGLTALSIVVCVVLFLGESWVESERIAYIFKLSQIMFPYIIFICTIGFLFGIFNYFGYFAFPAFSSVLTNIDVIFGTWVAVWLFKDDYDRITLLAWIVLLTGIIQWLMYAPLIKKLQIPLKFCLDLKHPGMSQFFRLYLPSVFAISILQINVLADKIIAVAIGPGAPSVLYYAERIYQLPLGIFAVSIALAALPEFSKSSSRADMESFTDQLNYSLKLSLFIAIPAGAGIVVLAKPIVACIFQRGAFDAHSTAQTAFALIFYSVGLFAFSSIKTITYAFYALKDSVTPTRVSFYCLLLNIGLNLALMTPMGVSGIALATTIAMTLNTVLLILKLEKRIAKSLFKPFMQATLRYTLVSGVMALLIFGLFKIMGPLLEPLAGTKIAAYGALAVSVVSGVAVYLGLSYAFMRKEVRTFLGR
jgi:putative peptidoglycan lipid II flippase